MALTALSLVVALVAPSVWAAENPPGPLAITGGRVMTMAGTIHDPGVVVVREGHIQSVGPHGTAIPSDARVIDASGCQVLPGFIAAGTHLGLTEIGAVKSTNDTNEVGDPAWPQLLVTDAFHAESELIPVARVEGITHALVEPGDENTIAGRSAVFRLAGRDTPDMLVRSPVALHVNLGEPPMRKFREAKKAPSTRMGAAALLRQHFIAAREYGDARARYARKKADYDKGKGGEDGKPPKEPTPPAVDLAKESLLDALEKRIPVVFRAQRRDDILTALRLSKELGLRPVISHGVEAWTIAERLAREGVPVLLGPVRATPGHPETFRANYENAALLHKAGVRLAFRHGWAHDVRNLPHHIGSAVAYGLPREAALRALTSDAAKILGVGDRIGSLEPGKEGTLLVVKGDPLEILSEVRHVIIRGEDLPLTSRHTRLRDRYTP